MLDLLIAFIFILICISSLRNIQVGFAMIFLVDFFFVRAVTFLGIIPLRELFMVVAWSFFLYHGIVKKEYKLSFNGVYKKHFLIFFAGILFIFILSTGEVGVSFQLKHIFGLIYYFSYAYIAWIIYNSQKDIEQLSKIMIVASLIMTIYGIFCYITTSNPYISMLENFSGKPIIAGIDFERGGLTGRIQSTMSHPLTWAGCCGLLILFYLKNDAKIQNSLKYLLMTLLGINLFLTGSRSAILALFISFTFLFFSKKKNTKTLLSIIIPITLFISAIYFVPQLQQYRGLFESSIFFWDDSMSDEMKGSSVNMREMQLLGTFQLIENNLLFGLGHGYVDYYISNFGPDPILFGFESLIYNKLAEGGIVDLLLWFYFFIILYRNINQINKKLLSQQDISVIKAYVIFYFTYSIFTGFMQTFLCFIIIYTILVKGLIISDKVKSNT